MLSVASLLNPAVPERRGTRLPSSPSSSLCTTSSTQNSPQLSNQSFLKKPKMCKDGAVFTKSKIKGEVNYPPFEKLYEETLREVQKFQVFPMGRITEFARHIPYNSEKKSFLEKTGRESFEVFQYTFKVPGDEKEYIVMWDYNTGLVRITPFFKCCKYSKTTPAKMLNMNPGLKEITHSITGGALAAQGYWMPYSCALAVCTTFCAHIAGALIPIFGPSFPSQCVPPEAPEHGRMIIDPSLITSATAEAEGYRQQYSSLPPSFSSKSTTPASTRGSYSPQLSLVEQPRNTLPYISRQLRLKRVFGADADTPYGTPPTESDMDTNASETSASSNDRAYFHSSVTPNRYSQPASGWEALNMLSHSANSAISINNTSPAYKSGANPVLSAIPRSSGLVDMQMSSVNWSGSAKRRAEEVVAEDNENDNDADAEYDAEESGVNSEMSLSLSEDCAKSDGDVHMEGSIGGAEKKAAWLLMRLSVRDGEAGQGMGLGMGCASEVKDDSEGPRIKRRRATSY